MAIWVPPVLYIWVAFKAFGFIRVSSAQSVFGQRENKHLYGHMSETISSEKANFDEVVVCCGWKSSGQVTGLLVRLC